MTTILWCGFTIARADARRRAPLFWQRTRTEALSARFKCKSAVFNHQMSATFYKGHLKVSTSSLANFVFVFLDFICVTLAHEKFRALYNYSNSRIFRSKSRMQNGRVSRTGDRRVKNFVTRVGWESHLKKQTGQVT